MIQVENLSKRYGKQTLFEGIGFKVNRKERVGVVGRNGHGKTTLFRILAGKEEPDEGTVSMPRNYRLGYVEQQLAFHRDTVLAEAVEGLRPDARDQVWRVEKVLAGLGFSRHDLAKAPSELSGGFQVRLNLAKVLLADYDMLLLDEPNNYLDITSIRWLERFLVAWPGELMLITHDRSFMDRVVTHTMAIHRRKIRKIEGPTGKLYAQIAVDEETYEKTRINDERRRKEIETFIAKFRASAQLQGLVESRKKTLAKMDKREKLETIKNLAFDFAYERYHGKYVLNAEGLTFGYEPGKPLVKDFGLCIGSRDRVFIVGPNGRGKTTLLKLLAGALHPDAGSVTSPAAVVPGYFEQTNVQSLTPHNTVLDEIQSADSGVEPGQARFLAGLMMFEGDDALKKIAVLSGGEKSRVLLSRIIASPVNLLLLDEPTNHLDLESSEALLEAIDSFPGAVVMVTHNEEFLYALAERLIVFQDGVITSFEGSYGRFLERVGWSGEEEKAKSAQAVMDAPIGGPSVPAPLPPSRKETRKLRSDVITEKSRVLRPLQQRISALEKRAEKAEADLTRMNKEVVEASQAKNGARIGELSKSLHQRRKDVDACLEELEPLLDEFEKKKAAFEQRLAELELEG